MHGCALFLAGIKVKEPSADEVKKILLVSRQLVPLQLFQSLRL
jgi:hypothetical protein